MLAVSELRPRAFLQVAQVKSERFQVGLGPHQGSAILHEAGNCRELTFSHYGRPWKLMCF